MIARLAFRQILKGRKKPSWVLKAKAYPRKSFIKLPGGNYLRSSGLRS